MQTIRYRLNRYLLAAFVLLLLSGAFTFMALVNSRSALAAGQAFSDIAIDHPAYQMCRQLIQLGAVKPYPGMALAPFEKISAEDWNYALTRLGEKLGRAFPESAKFSSDSEISGETIYARVQLLVEDATLLPSESTGNNSSRLFAYFTLERYLVDYND